MKRSVCLVIVLLVLFQVISVSAIFIKPSPITGRATVQQTEVSLFISPTMPTISILRPENKTYITNKSLLLNYTSTNADDIWYNIDGGENKTITSSTYFNVSQGEHTLNIFVSNLWDDGSASDNITFNCNSSKFIIIYNEYKGIDKGNSMDFITYPYEDIQSLNNIVLEHTDFGKIVFNSAINLTEGIIPDSNTLNLDINSNISFNRIHLDSITLFNFDKPATVYIYNLSFSDPKILRNGAPCDSSICTFVNYSGGTLVFNVTAFSMYSAEETPASESSSGGSGGGGGGGGGGGDAGVTGSSGSSLDSIGLDKERIKVSLIQGDTKKEQLVITNPRNEKLKISLDVIGLEDILNVSEYEFEIEANESKTIDLEFITNEDLIPDLYVGKLLVKSVGIEEEVLIAINVNKGSLLEVKAEILNKSLQILSGDDLFVIIKILNKGENIDAVLEYMIKDEDGNVILEKLEDWPLKTRTSYLASFNIPESVSDGAYIFNVKVTYGKEVASSSAWFLVGKSSLLKILLRETMLNTVSLILNVMVFLLSVLMIILLVIGGYKRDKDKDSKTK